MGGDLPPPRLSDLLGRFAFEEQKGKNGMSKQKKNNINYGAMRCPYCGGTVSYRSAKGIYKAPFDNAMLYVCNNYPECDSYVKCHDGTKIPMGSLANKELRMKRKEAHKYIAELQNKGLQTKEGTYTWLHQISLDGNCHIGSMGLYACNQVIAEAQKILDGNNIIKERKKSEK